MSGLKKEGMTLLEEMKKMLKDMQEQRQLLFAKPDKTKADEYMLGMFVDSIKELNNSIMDVESEGE